MPEEDGPVDSPGEPQAVKIEVHSLSGEELFRFDALESCVSCSHLLEHARKIFELEPVHGYLKALFFDGEPLEGEQTLQEFLGTVGDGVPRRFTAVVVPVDFRPRPGSCDARLSVDPETGCKVVLGNERILPGGPGHMYPAAIAPALKPGLLHYFEVKMTSARPGERVSFRMGVCRSFPDGYLGKNADAASFWFDDGDAYTKGERFHAGALQMNVPMNHDDLVGVLVDLRSPESFSLEFVLNRQSTGPGDGRMSRVYVEGEPLYPCVSFCTNHPGCQAEITYLGDPPEDIRPFDEKMGRDPTFFLRPELMGPMGPLLRWLLAAPACAGP
eukprot:s2057_g10.t1